MNIKTGTFPERLSFALQYRGMTQQELAEISNINKGNMSRYINGIAKPKMDKIELMARILDVNGAWLMGYDVPMLDDGKIELRNIIKNKIDTLTNEQLEKLNILIDTMFIND